MGIGVTELFIVLFLAVFGCGGVVILVLAIVLSQRRNDSREASKMQPSGTPAPRGAASPPPPATGISAVSRVAPSRNSEPDGADARVNQRESIIASLTRKFCPQCRVSLSADAPEGLCPACLFAGANSSLAGLAVTTPPLTKATEAGLPSLETLQQRFPQLEILELLGRGGMGAVYKARQKNLDRFVALKIILPGVAADPAFSDRFSREARLLAKLNHPNIVAVYDFGELDGLHFLLMEYVDGVNLRQTLRAGRLSPQEALAITPHLCDALQFAHDQGVIHRDIKPENILLDRLGRVKIADFGLAKLIARDAGELTLTGTQQVLGTPRYMAPEQMDAPTTVDHRADIFALGVMLYEMLTGETPMGNFPPPSERVQVDVRIDQVVLRALEREPARRYQRASELKSDLNSAVSWPSFPSPQPKSSVSPRVAKQVQSAEESSPPVVMLLAIAAGIVLGMALLALGVGMGFYGILKARSGYPEQLAYHWLIAFGFTLVGGGTFLGCYFGYHRFAGAVDLLRSSERTWFDYLMRTYLVVAILLLCLAPAFLAIYGVTFAVITGSMVLQGGLIFVLRWVAAAGQSSHAEPILSPEPNARIRQQLRGPGIALITSALIDLVLVPLAVLITGPAFTRLKPQEYAPPVLKTDGVIGGAAVFFPTPLLAQAVAPPAVSDTPAWRTWLFVILLLLCGCGGFAVTIVVLLGGWQMFHLRAYGLCLTAAVLALLPIRLGWVVGLPAGIWALTQLLRGEVREAFSS